MADTDGWTHVSKKSKQYGRTPTAFAVIPPRTEPGLTLAKIETHFDERMQTWRKDKIARTQLYQVLDRLAPEGGWSIRTAVCMGYGSFSRDNWQGRHRTALQVAMFLDVVDYLERMQGSRIELYAQELRYTDLDREFLASKGFTVLELDPEAGKHCGPAAYHMGPETFVCELFMEHNLETIGAIIDRRNQLMLTTARLKLDSASLARGESATGALLDRNGDTAAADQIQQLKESFDINYRMYQFPHFEGDPNAMGGLRICGPAPTEDD